MSPEEVEEEIDQLAAVEYVVENLQSLTAERGEDGKISEEELNKLLQGERPVKDPEGKISFTAAPKDFKVKESSKRSFGRMVIEHMWKNELAQTQREITVGEELGDFIPSVAITKLALRLIGKTNFNDPDAVGDASAELFSEIAIGLVTNKIGKGANLFKGKISKIASKAGAKADKVAAVVKTVEGAKQKVKGAIQPWARSQFRAMMKSAKQAEAKGVKVIKQVGWQEHHIIPKMKRFSEHPLVKRSGLNINSKLNKMSLPSKRELDPLKTLHRGKPDEKALRRLMQELNDAESIAKRESWSQQRSLEEIKKIIAKESEGLNSGKFHLNQAE